MDHLSLQAFFDQGGHPSQFFSTVPPAMQKAAVTPPTKKGRKKKPKKWRKPAGMPKRPLSAYNIFFAQERQKLLEEQKEAEPPVVAQGQGSGIGFANLARTVAAKWKVLTDEAKEPFVKKAGKEQEKYKAAVEEWQRRGLDPRRGKKTVTPGEGGNSSLALKQSMSFAPGGTVPANFSGSRLGTPGSMRPSIAAYQKAFGESPSFGVPSTNRMSTADSLRAASEISEAAILGFNGRQTSSEPHRSSQVHDQAMGGPLLSANGQGHGYTVTKSIKGHPGAGAGPQDASYKDLSSRLFQELTSKLDGDEVNFLQSTFARSA